MKTRQHNGPEHDGHGEVEVQERHGGPQTPKRSVPTHPPVRSVAVWGPIAVVSVLALLVIVGVWRHMRAHKKRLLRLPPIAGATWSRRTSYRNRSTIKTKKPMKGRERTCSSSRKFRDSSKSSRRLLERSQLEISTLARS